MAKVSKFYLPKGVKVEWLFQQALGGYFACVCSSSLLVCLCLHSHDNRFHASNVPCAA